jgi:hypothetical protein
MKMLNRFANWLVSHLFTGAMPDYTPSRPLSRYDHVRHENFHDDYLAGYPRRARQDDYLADFPSRPIVNVVHGWKPPSPSRLPVDD